MRLAGTYHPIEYILLRLEEFFPTLENSGAIYLSGQQLHYFINGDEQEIQVFDQVNIQKIRSKQSYTSEWTQSPNLLDTPIYAKQNTLYDEEKNTTLLIYLPSEKLDFSDVVILTFPKNQVMKGLGKVFSGLSTSEKSLLGAFTLNVLKSEFERVLAERKIVHGFSHVQKHQISKIEKLTLHLEETKSLYLNSLKVLINEYLEKLSKEFDCVFSPSDDLIERIAQHHIGIDEIYASLRSAVEVGYHLLFGEKEIKIIGSYLKSDSLNPKNTEVRQEQTDKIAHLLDRYEEAAVRLQSLSMPINGKNVAKQLDPPVTPPAISDAVKKNNKRIRFLLEQYSDKWVLIRKYLKPIERLNTSNDSGVRRAI